MAKRLAGEFLDDRKTVRVYFTDNEDGDYVDVPIEWKTLQEAGALGGLS